MLEEYNYTIENKDCLEFMKEIPDNYIDCVVTDCPYRIVQGGCTNIPLKNEPRGMLSRRNTFTAKNSRSGKLFEHNDIKFSEWLPDIYRVLKDNTHCYIMINARNLMELQQEAEKVGFKFQQLIVWNKGNSIPNRYYLNSCEFILMLRKGAAKNINNMGSKNVLDVPNIRGGKLHPTEKPVQLMKILVENSTQPGEIVLDPFMGAGSTGIASLESGRKFIGIELDKQYFDIAEKRIKELLQRDTDK